MGLGLGWLGRISYKPRSSGILLMIQCSVLQRNCEKHANSYSSTFYLNNAPRIILLKYSKSRREWEFVPKGDKKNARSLGM